jgi:F-type H+-transporting ATPase subunit b
MRTSLLARLMTIAGLLAVLTPATAFAAEGGADLLSPNYGLMVWTLIIFVILLLVLSKFAFKPILAAVEAREEALSAAIEGAKRDREEAARVLAEHRQQLEGARAEAQRLIAEGRTAADRVRADLMEQARAEQQEIVARARRDIESERDRAIADLRREAVDLSIAGASKVIEKNLDSAGNRQLVESFLASIKPAKAS